MARVIRWLCSRVGVIYVLVILFCFTCIDLKMLGSRIKIRHLNDSIPNFSWLIDFTLDQNVKKDIDWKPFKDYFQLVLSLMPDDLVTMNLLGYVDYFTGHEQDSIALFKNAAVIKGQNLFWPNYNLGVIYYKKGNWPQSAMYLLNAIGSNPPLTVLLLQDSMIYRQISYYGQISLGPSFKLSFNEGIANAQSRAYILLLSCLFQMRQYDKMLVIANLAAANPVLSYKDAFYYYAGLALLEEGQMDRALLLFQKSLTIEKANPDVYYYIAGIYQKAGQLQQARDFLQISYALHQKNDPRFPYEAKADLRFY